MAKNPTLSELTSRIAEITSGPPRELVEAVVKALQANRGAPVEVQARAAIAAIGEVDIWRPAAPTAPGTTSRQAVLDAALPDFERMVEETGILRPKP